MHRMAAVFTRVVVMMLFCLPVLAHGQGTTSQQPSPAPASGSQQSQQPSTLDDELAAGDEDNPNPVRQLVKWNHFEGKYLILKVGGGFLYEYDAYAQDRDSKEQFS